MAKGTSKRITPSSVAEVAVKPVTVAKPKKVEKKEVAVKEVKFNPAAVGAWDYGWLSNDGVVKIKVVGEPVNAAATVEKLLGEERSKVSLNRTSSEKKLIGVVYQEVTINGVHFQYPKGGKVVVPASIEDELLGKVNQTAEYLSQQLGKMS